ncbi:MAG: HEPN domain-containing protein, partial [Candidatus Magnetoglobus multicellularis str. Araruama]
MTKNEHIEYWIDISQYDLETAEVMMNGKKYLYVGFMCHQSVEKMIKAYYVFLHNSTPMKTHNLRRLSKKINLYDKLSDEQKDLIDMLNPLNVEARYPTYKQQLLKSLSYDKCKDILIKQGN